MKKLLLILLFLTVIGFGQEWTYGGINDDYGNSIQQTTDGGYIICGTTLSFSINRDIYLIKADVNGNEIWTKTLGDLGNDYGYSVQQTNDGGYIVCGTTEDLNGDKNVFLAKIDGNGNNLWSKTFGGSEYDEGISVKQTTDGGYIIAGVTFSFGNGPSDVYIIKTDDDGNELWNKTFGGPGYDYGYSVQQTSYGGYVISGGTDSENGGDIYLIKTDDNGDSLWTKTIGGNSEDYSFSVQQTTDGGYIIAGSANSFGNGDSDVYLIKTDASGNELWNKTFGGSEYDEGYSIQQTTDGGYIIAGITNSIGNGNSDVYLIKTDGSGNELWNKTFGGSEYDEGYSVQQTTDGGYIIAGSTNSIGNGNSDVYLIKTDGNGNVTSTFNIPLNSNRKLEKIVDILGKETKSQTNTPLIEIYDDGSTEKKIIIE